MKKSLVSAVLLAFVFAGCRHKKEAGSSASNPIVLDTLHVTAPPIAEAFPYRGSNTLPNNLLHTRLYVSFDWERSRLNGRAELELQPYFYPVDRLSLNARGMEIKSVQVFTVPAVTDTTVRGNFGNERRQVNAATYTYDGDSLHIEFGVTLHRGQRYVVTVGYIAKPEELSKAGGSAAIIDDKGLYFINPRGENPFRMRQVWTQGETQSSSVWFPTIDSPNEKTTQEIFIDVDNKFTTLSNGRLVNSTRNADGTRTDHWKMEKPHAPYLAMMAVGEFVKVTDEPWEGKEVSYYVEKEYAADAKAIFAETREMIDFYSRVLGVPYPWEKYAQVVVREYVSGAMENTSATLHGDFMVYQTQREIAQGRKGTAVIAHELFHQWFGDLVTCESWSNLPLNESFATYGEYLWEEYKRGREAADEHSWQSRQGYIHSKQEADLIRFYYRDKEDMFDVISYNKGGQVVHMLRKVVGDEAFFSSLKKYLETNAFKPVEIHHLRLAFEEVTGRDLNWFFNQWFLANGRPRLKVGKTYDTARAAVRMIVEQTQDLSEMPLYRLPLQVDLYYGEKITRHNIEIDGRIDTFYFAAKTPPDLVNFDAERSLLADVEYPRSKEELFFQYDHAKLFADRMEALQLLSPLLQDSSVYAYFLKAAIRDKSGFIRKFVVTRLEKSSPSYSLQTKKKLLGMVENDSAAHVRVAALAVLNKRFLNDPDIISLNDRLLDDRHPVVCAEAITSLSKRDPERAMQATLRYNKERSRDIIMAVTALYGVYGSDGHIGFFRNAVPYVTGFDMLPFCASYGKLAQRCSLPGSVLMIASDLENFGKGASKYTRYGSAKALKDIILHFEGKEASLKTQAGTVGSKEGAEKQLAEVSDLLATLRKMLERAITNQ